MLPVLLQGSHPFFTASWQPTPGDWYSGVPTCLERLYCAGDPFVCTMHVTMFRSCIGRAAVLINNVELHMARGVCLKCFLCQTAPQTGNNQATMHHTAAMCGAPTLHT